MTTIASCCSEIGQDDKVSSLCLTENSRQNGRKPIIEQPLPRRRKHSFTKQRDCLFGLTVRSRNAERKSRRQPSVSCPAGWLGEYYAHGSVVGEGTKKRQGRTSTSEKREGWGIRLRASIENWHKATFTSAHNQVVTNTQLHVIVNRKMVSHGA